MEPHLLATFNHRSMSTERGTDTSVALNVNVNIYKESNMVVQSIF